MTTAKTKRIQPGYEPIKGYVLEKRIGRGGYGEVWRAEAPGGLKKAVKFVFGQQDERRAEQELKSLERIKAVQHPFILTLERFGLIENQLVIVTELADCSLEDIFNQHRERGSCGIARDALLGYVKDAADALDYLHQLYKLQHLDIKPANLLIVGGRVKVADFGLLKDLGEVECSLVGGLTPIYAPPEVFDGRPSMHSDQYSLAVMYQELLTGTRPFSGRTIAQLATQHVHNAPNLNPLPASDRPSVARALEKSPERRYESCSDFVDKLLNPHGNVTPSIQGGPAADSASQHKVENLPQLGAIDAVEKTTNQTHALVVALGGTGADCLHKLRTQIQELGSGSPMILHSVLIDTDQLSTQTVGMIPPTQWVPRCRPIATPLKSPTEYRASGTDRLKTISRRWIYNVPRNGQTGGVRPLGRLALVDHGKEVIAVLRDAVDELKQSLSDNASAKIYVVGSLTGGSGSGMYIDVVHLLRGLLDAAAMEKELVLSFLTTNRFQGDPARPLALHATKSAIRELMHFLKPGNSYPGDIGAGWPSIPSARTPLGDTYVIAQSDAPGAPAAIDAVVDYLWADANICGDWFESGRNDDDESSVKPISTRSLSVIQIGDPRERQASLLAPYASRKLLLRWLGNPSGAAKSAGEFFSRVVRRCYLEANAMRVQTEQWLGESQSDRREKLIEHLKTVDPSVLKQEQLVRADLIKWLTQTVDLNQTDVVAGQVMQKIDREILLRLGDGRLDLSSAILGISELRRHLQQLHQQLIDQIEDESKGAQGVTSVDGAADSDDGDAGANGPLASLRLACDVGEHLAGIFASRVAAALAATIDAKLSDLTEQYSDASARIAQGIKKMNDEMSSESDPWKALDSSIRERKTAIVEELHGQTVSTHLFHIIQSPASSSVESITSKLNAVATTLIREGIESSVALGMKTTQCGESATSETRVNSDSDVCGLSTDIFFPGETVRLNSIPDSAGMTQTLSWSDSKELPALTVESAVQAVRPPLLDCGGKQRLYLICRDKSEQARIEAQLPKLDGLSLTPILVRSAMPMLVHEAQGIEMKNIVSWLDSLTSDDGRISDRLATRCDIDWT